MSTNSDYYLYYGDNRIVKYPSTWENTSSTATEINTLSGACASWEVFTNRMTNKKNNKPSNTLDMKTIKTKTTITHYLPIPGCTSKDVSVRINKNDIKVEAQCPLTDENQKLVYDKIEQTITFNSQNKKETDNSQFISVTIAQGLLTIVINRDIEGVSVDVKEA